MGTCSLEAIHLVGHTPGSIALLYDDPEGQPHLHHRRLPVPGRAWARRTSPRTSTPCYTGVVAKLFDRLPDETWVYPGHGWDTTIGAERPSLAEWRDRGW